ncbi:hypothetical protein GF324_07000 [bacterium]|nr:hypothetical protein [bacterium]
MPLWGYVMIEGREITSGKEQALTGILESYRKALETRVLEQRLEELERKVNR